MSKLERALKKYRRELLRRERKAASSLVRAYGQAWLNIRGELTKLDAEYAMMENDEEWLYKYNRLTMFHNQVELELLKFSQYADATTRQQMHEAIEAAVKHSEELTRIVMGKPPAGLQLTWVRFSPRVVEEAVGLVQPDSPLHELFLSIAKEGAEKAENILVQNILLGKSPKQTAPLIRKALGVELGRALTIARTETLRAYRQATRQSYLENKDIVRGWIWVAACDLRTCPTCWAMNGTEHPIDEVLSDHPNGRCTSVAITKSWAEIGKEHGLDLSGITETKPVIQSGEERFRALAEDQQIAILGVKKWEAWMDGRITLQDLVGVKEDPVWGKVHYEKSLAELGLRE